jgi:hypothetical protein
MRWLIQLDKLGYQMLDNALAYSAASLGTHASRFVPTIDAKKCALTLMHVNRLIKCALAFRHVNTDPASVPLPSGTLKQTNEMHPHLYARQNRPSKCALALRHVKIDPASAPLPQCT